MPGKENPITSSTTAIVEINHALRFLGKTFSETDLERAIRTYLGLSVEADFNAIVETIEMLDLIQHRLNLSNPDFIALFGNDLDELLFESLVSIGEKGGHTAIQLYNRNLEQLNQAHRLLSTRGVRLDAAIPLIEGGYFNLLFSGVI